MRHTTSLGTPESLFVAAIDEKESAALSDAEFECKVFVDVFDDNVPTEYAMEGVATYGFTIRFVKVEGSTLDIVASG
jgi:hypothetical protein